MLSLSSALDDIPWNYTGEVEIGSRRFWYKNGNLHSTSTYAWTGEDDAKYHVLLGEFLHSDVTILLAIS